MKLSKVLESLYLKVFVGIVARHEKHDVVIEMVKGKEVKERIAKSFPTDNGIDKLVDFLKAYINESPFYYIALLNPKGDQGAVPSCKTQELESYIDLSTSITLCQQKKWSLYAAKPDLDQLQKDYARIGLDFIFSPFAIISSFFEDKTSEGHGLFVLIQDDAVSVSVYQDGMMLFSEQLMLESEEDSFGSLDDDAISMSFELDADGLNEGIDLDDINAIDELEGLDDLNDIEDLDAVHDLESFEEEITELSETSLDFTDEPGAKFEDQGEPPSSFNDDFQRFQLIQEALNNYYTGDNFKQEFIETVYIADASGVSDDLKNYLEEELFMKVYVRRIDLALAVVDMAKVEAKYAV